jgi:hypothetical protein
MVRCLFGLFVLTAGLVALTSAAKETRFSVPKTTPTPDAHPQETEAVAASAAARNLLHPARVFGASFSLN